MRWCLLVLWLLGASTGFAQAPRLSEAARISLVTVYPGSALYSAFGHSALRVHDPLHGWDVAYNYGTFDFEAPGFYLRFARGQLNYFLSRARFADLVAFYTEVEGRGVVEQVLHLTPEERQTLFDFLEWNARPENRYYPYDFFLDNCSTRIRDALERTLEIRYDSSGLAPTTFRALIDPYLHSRPFLRAGIHLVLGAPADARATYRQRLFLPLELMEGLARARRPDGQPLVVRTDTLGGQPALPAAGPDLPAMLAWGLLLLSLGLALRGWITGKLPTSTGLDRLMFGLAGLIGWVLLGLMLLTEHRVASPNWNLVWALPTHFLVVWRRNFELLSRKYWILTLLSTIFTLVLWSGVGPQSLPGFALPVALFTGWRALWYGWLGPRARQWIHREQVIFQQSG